MTFLNFNFNKVITSQNLIDKNVYNHQVINMRKQILEEKNELIQTPEHEGK